MPASYLCPKLGGAMIGWIGEIKLKLVKFKQGGSFLSELVFRSFFSQTLQVPLFYAITVFCYFYLFDQK